MRPFLTWLLAGVFAVSALPVDLLFNHAAHPAKSVAVGAQMPVDTENTPSEDPCPDNCPCPCCPHARTFVLSVFPFAIFLDEACEFGITPHIYKPQKSIRYIFHPPQVA